MKLLPLLITVSVVANGAVVAVLATRSPATGPADSASTISPSVQATAKQSGAAAPVDPQLWSNLAAKDSVALIAKLRAAGFPPSVVRAILTAQIGAEFAARRRALYPAGADTPFWKHNQPTDPKLAAALRDLAKEQTAQINQLFGGPDPDGSLHTSLYERQQFGDLPGDKISQLSRVKRDYDELRSELLQSAGLSGGFFTLLPEDRAKLALLEKEQRADLAKILTPQEMEDYELRTNTTAMQMRYNLSAFAPTEAEFRAIFKIQQAFDLENARISSGMTPEQMRQRGEAQKLLTTQINATLGSERGADYARATDYNFQQVNRVVERLELPKTATIAVWNVQQDIEKRANALRLDATLAPAVRSAQLAALAQEATTKVTSALGQRGYDVYKQNGASWLQNLQSPSSGGTRGVIFTP